MLIESSKFDELFNEATRRGARAGSPIVLFVALDCDALCASRILSTLLKREHTSYSIHPVSGYEDLKAQWRKLAGEQDIHSAFFLNCGANVSLREFLSLDDCGDMLACVVDSHRPLDLGNVYDGEDSSCKIRVLVEDAKEQEELEATTDRLMDAQEAGHESAREEGDSDGEDEEDEESEEDEDDSDDSDGEGAERPAQRRRTSDGGDSVDAGEARDADKAGSEEEEGDEDEDPYEKRKRRRRRARKAQREVKKMVESYYSETYYASTAASLTFNLACQLNRNTNSLLWLNIVALTDYLINERYTNEYYAEKVDALHREVGRLNIERDVDGDEAGEGGALAPRGRSAVVGERIEFIEEYRFMLHRWWTLYDSMYHSSYVASRLGIWKEPGRRKLNTFLAKMGMPLNQCRQKWAHMKFGLKTELKARVLQYSAEFGLEQLTYGSFEKLNGFRQRISAADAVYSVGALLEERGEIGSTVEDAHALNVRNFWSAYSALAGEGEEGAGGSGSGAGGAQSKLEHGVHQAIAQQQLVVHQGTIVIEKRIMTDCGKHFRWITLKETVDPHVFAHPLGLSKLAHFLSNAMIKTTKRRSRPRALVVASLVPEREVYLVVGVVGASSSSIISGASAHNKFGALFKKAADNTGAQTRLDSFDMSVIEIKKEHLRRVYEYLSIADF